MNEQTYGNFEDTVVGMKAIAGLEAFEDDAQGEVELRSDTASDANVHFVPIESLVQAAAEEEVELLADAESAPEVGRTIRHKGMHERKRRRNIRARRSSRSSSGMRVSLF